MVSGVWTYGHGHKSKWLIWIFIIRTQAKIAKDGFQICPETSQFVLSHEIDYFIVVTCPLHQSLVRKRSVVVDMIEIYNTCHRFPCY